QVSGATALSTGSGEDASRPTRTSTSTPTPSPTPTTPSPTPTSTPTAVPVPPASSMSGLHVVGGQIQNGAGFIVQLIGVHRSTAEYACVDGYGIFDGPVDQSEVADMKTWNIHAVRVVLNEDCWLGINGVKAAFSGVTY